MKKTLTALALAALLTGCASDNASASRRARATQPGKHAPTAPATYQKGAYSWDANPVTANATKFSAPEDPSLAVISAIRGDKGLLSLLRAEKPAPGSQFVLLKDEKPLLITIVEVDGDVIVASIPANQAEIPTLTVGSEVRLTAVPAKQE